MQHIAQFIEYAKKERGYSGHTIKSYTYDLKCFDEFMVKYVNNSEWDVSEVDRHTIRHFLGKEFEQGYSSQTVARRLATIKSFFNYLHRSNAISVNPAADVKTPKVPKSLPVVLSEQLIEEMMERPPDTKKGKRDRAILELFNSSGIRLSELVSLNMGNFLTDRKQTDHSGIVKVLGKGNRERIVPYGERAGKALKDYFESRPIDLKTCDQHEPCFVNSSGKRLSSRTVQRIVTKYINLVTEGSSIGPHTLRHTLATNMINIIKNDETIDIRSLQELLGHSSLSSTQIYTQVQTEKMKKIYKQAHPHGE